MAFSYNGNPAGQTQPMAEINMIPLVDIMLVLLVIFIITAPLFQQAVPIDLPKVDATRIDEAPQAIVVALDAEGNLFLDGEAVAAPLLAERLAAAAQAGAAAPELHLRADRDTRYERVTEVMALAQQAGITRIAFVTDSPDAAQAVPPAP
ncbi:MAG: ExbD/TolR family protein [Gammaproteobacteria bacterium]